MTQHPLFKVLILLSIPVVVPSVIVLKLYISARLFFM